MENRNKKSIDGILRHPQISDARNPHSRAQISYMRPGISGHNPITIHNSYGFAKRRPNTRRISFGKFGRFLLTSKISLILVLIISVVPMAAFEAHVVNVTATIEKKPCQELTIQSKGFWFTHSSLWILPQTLGSDTIATSTDVTSVFNANNSSMRNKLKKQLLALEFNVAYYSSENALVPQSTTTLADLIAQANALLTQNPPPSQGVLEMMKNGVESANEAGTVSTCPQCPSADKVLLGYNYLLNGTTTVSQLRGNVNAGDHVKVNFTLAAGCENQEFSLVSYKAPSYIFDANTANQQSVFDSATGFFSAGLNMMEIDVPKCYFQIDLVRGGVIEHLGPAGSNNFYGAQGRLIDADNGDSGAGVCASDDPPFQSLSQAAGIGLTSLFDQTESTSTGTFTATGTDTLTTDTATSTATTTTTDMLHIEEDDTATSTTISSEDIITTNDTGTTTPQEGTIPPDQSADTNNNVSSATSGRTNMQETTGHTTPPSLEEILPPDSGTNTSESLISSGGGNETPNPASQ